VAKASHTYAAHERKEPGLPIPAGIVSGSTGCVGYNPKGLYRLDEFVYIVALGVSEMSISYLFVVYHLAKNRDRRP
jgi:hypothetical protein